MAQITRRNFLGRAGKLSAAATFFHFGWSEAGRIALQSEGVEVFYRDALVKPLR
ncbi:MAG TPA: hypothetical protein VNG91_07930 [Terriglobia bacterium]|nr:hypothetical protein [Terriglobia bacterium]